ncbi:MAG: hypothetical protein AAGE85_01495 [Pseudomonadota bacterium]
MTGNRHTRRGRFVTGSAAVLLCAFVLATAQEREEEPNDAAESNGDSMDEIVVTVQKPGDRTRAETPYEELMRERLIKEMDAMRELEEEYAWRKSATPAEPSRIRLGYRAQDDNRDRRDTDLTDLPMENTKPATLFRFEF